MPSFSTHIWQRFKTTHKNKFATVEKKINVENESFPREKIC